LTVWARHSFDRTRACHPTVSHDRTRLKRPPGTLREGELTAAAAGPSGADAADAYRLPDAMAAAAEEQYRRDVARVHGGEGGAAEDEYKSFLQVGGWVMGDGCVVESTACIWF
jgi:hypothetical protein